MRRLFLASVVLGFTLTGLNPGSALAADPFVSDPAVSPVLAMEIKKTRTLGINYHQLDDHTRLLGWRLTEDWYFGRSRAESSEVVLIWRANEKDQFSLSKDGLRFQRRF